MIELHTRNPNHISLALIIGIVVLGLTWIAFSYYAVPPMIQSAYRGQSFAIFNKMISGQTSHPLAEYIADWDHFRRRALAVFCLLGLLITLATRPEFRAVWQGNARPALQEYKASVYASYVCASLAILTFYSLLLSVVGANHAELFFDPHDLMIFFNSSAWAVGRGKLYVDVRSEYPIFANLIFGLVRFFASKVRVFGFDFYNFCLLWISVASATFVCLLRPLQKQSVFWGSCLLLLLLAPSTIYFSLYRYDIYPVVFSFWGLDCLRKREWNLAALLFGICIALKGYALIVVPSFFVFCVYQAGIGPAIVAVIIMLLPAIGGNVAVFAWGGKEALLAPYKLQVFRGFNGESSFDSLFFLGSHLSVSKARMDAVSTWLLENHVPKIMQAAVAFGVCLFRPSRFESFVDAAFVSVLGFITFSSFYSPQYVLWLVPFLLFTDDWVLLFLGIFLAWSTYAYFPVSYYIKLGHPDFFGFSVLLVTTTRFIMLAKLVKKLVTNTPLYAPAQEGLAES